MTALSRQDVTAWIVREDVGDGAEVENREVTGCVSIDRPGGNVIGKGDLISWLPVCDELYQRTKGDSISKVQGPEVYRGHRSSQKGYYSLANSPLLLP